jgi:hypothetical protein
MTITETDHLRLCKDAYLGTAQVPVGCIYFKPYGPGSRLVKHRNVETLVDLFRRKYHPLRPENHILVLIPMEDLEDALRRSNLSRDSLDQTDPPFLSVNPGKPLRGLHGKLRWEAVKSCFQNSAEQPCCAVTLLQDGGRWE